MLVLRQKIKSPIYITHTNQIYIKKKTQFFILVFLYLLIRWICLIILASNYRNLKNVNSSSLLNVFQLKIHPAKAQWFVVIIDNFIDGYLQLLHWYLIQVSICYFILGVKWAFVPSTLNLNDHMLHYKLITIDKYENNLLTTQMINKK